MPPEVPLGGALERGVDVEDYASVVELDMPDDLADEEPGLMLHTPSIPPPPWPVRVIAARHGVPHVHCTAHETDEYLHRTSRLTRREFGKLLADAHFVHPLSRAMPGVLV